MKRADHIRSEFRAHSALVRSIHSWPRLPLRVELDASERRARARRESVRAAWERREQRRIIGEIIGATLSAFAAIFLAVSLLALVNFAMKENAKREAMRAHVETLQNFGSR